jgi:hypothetical protein
MITMLAAVDCFRNGKAASTATTVPIRSVLNPASQDDSSLATDNALTLGTRMSMPPRCFAEAATQARNASRSATSSCWPKAVTPRVASALTVSSTSAWLRAQIETSAPSAANCSAMARPMPLVPPVIRAFRPVRSVAAIVGSRHLI